MDDIERFRLPRLYSGDVFVAGICPPGDGLGLIRPPKLVAEGVGDEDKTPLVVLSVTSVKQMQILILNYKQQGGEKRKIY